MKRFKRSVLKRHERLRELDFPTNFGIRWVFQHSENHQEICKLAERLNNRIKQTYLLRSKRIEQQIKKRKDYLCNIYIKKKRAKRKLYRSITLCNKATVKALGILSSKHHKSKV